MGWHRQGKARQVIIEQQPEVAVAAAGGRVMYRDHGILGCSIELLFTVGAAQMALRCVLLWLQTTRSMDVYWRREGPHLKDHVPWYY